MTKIMTTWYHRLIHKWSGGKRYTHEHSGASGCRVCGAIYFYSKYNGGWWRKGKRLDA